MLWLNSLRLRAQASSRIKQSRTARGVPPLKKEQLPWRAGAKRRGDCLLRMVWRGAGHHGGKRKRLASELFGGTDFPLENYRFKNLFCKENWGDRKPEGRALASGVARRDARKGRQSPAFGCGRLPGDSETKSIFVL